MEHICKTILGYDKIYTRKGYGIECDDCELKQREQALFYIKSRMDPALCNLENSCIACGIDNNLNYSCSFLTITSTASNNLRAQVKTTTYCYRPSTDDYVINLYLGIGFDTPGTNIYVYNTHAKYSNGDIVSNTSETLTDYGDELYVFSFIIPNNASSSTSVTVKTSVADDVTTLYLINTIQVDKTCDI